MAGSEKRGAENARADLFDERVCILTPTATTDPAALERATLFFGKRLGCVVKLLSPEEHGPVALATTSHLPHLLASLLAGQLPAKWQPFAATGFRDTTRVAAGDPALWTAIARENALALSLTLDQFSERFNKLQAAVLNGDADALNDILTAGKKVRDALGS